MTAITDVQSAELQRTSDDLYEKYGKPLERDHWGEFLAVSPQGDIVLASSLLEVAQMAAERFGTGNFLYRIGPRAVGRFHGRLSRE
jgi:hypothetical protein